MKPTRGRMLFIAGMVLAVFLVIFLRLNQLLIWQHDENTARADVKSTKTLSLTGMRGTIYDGNMVPLAYNRRSYNVTFYRDPSRMTAEDRYTYTQSIIAAIRLIESNGKSTVNDLWLKRDENGVWEFNSGSTSTYVEDTRESQWRSNFRVKTIPEWQLFDVLCSKYYVPEDLDEEMKIKVLSIWQESRMNAYNSMPVPIAYDVGFETVSEVEAQSMSLDGFGVEESSVRVYPQGSTAAHVIGYTSRITTDAALAEYRAKGYPTDAVVGASGIESYMEDQLSPYIEYRKGKRVVEIDTRGKIVREMDYEAPVDGNSIVLTIDTRLEEVMADALESTIPKIHGQQQDVIADESWQKRNEEELKKYAETDREIQLARTGAMIAMDPNTGRVLGMVSYPSFDLSLFEGVIDAGAWSEIQNDDRNPLYNRAISTRDTPGSIFKLCTALAGLSEGAITLDTRISDQAEGFTLTDASRAPKCWTVHVYKHSNQTVSDAIKNSCNFFFYTVGYRLGSEKLTEWAAALGLTSRTNVELPGESTPFVGNQNMLYDSARAINDQYTAKPLLVANAIKASLIRIGEERNIIYDDDRLNEIVKEMLDLVTQYKVKTQWYTPIQQILVYDLNIPVSYVRSHYLINTYVSYLQDLFWTSNETIMAAIGQSITQVTPISVARYVSAIANGGTVYDAQVIDKVIAPDGTVVLDKTPVIANQIIADPRYFAAIKTGMENVTSTQNEGTAAEQFKNAKYPIAAKTGTAQRTDLDVENNSWLVCYAPKEDPQIVVVVYIQNGYAGARSAPAAIQTIEYYLDNLLSSKESSAAPRDNTISD